jgi:predicted metal-dependent hydrolase
MIEPEDRRPAIRQLALDLEQPTASRERPPAPLPEQPPQSPPRRPALPPIDPTAAEQIVIEHAGQRLVLPVRRDRRARRASVTREPREGRVVVIVPSGEPLDRARRLVRKIAGTVADWLRPGFRPAERIGEERIAVHHDGRDLPVLLQRSLKARRFALRVHSARRIVVLVVPMRADREAAIRFARSQAAWIDERLKAMPPASPFVDGGEVLLRGMPHRIRHRPERRGTVWLEDGTIHVAGDARHVARRLRDWLVREAQREMPPLVRAKAERLAGIRPGHAVRSIALRDTSSRWGSCGPDGSIMLSWRMLLAPPEVLDYLIAHEVAHLAEPNHSRRFWTLCQQLMDGDMAAARRWLKRHGDRLLQYGADDGTPSAETACPGEA